jgi:membrane protein YqaA with SNARE-associated domain
VANLGIPEIIVIIADILQNPIFVNYGLAGLFVNGFLASTAIPIPLGITVVALLTAGQDPFIVLVVLAVSTYLGGFVGYILGRSGNKLFNFLKGTPKKDEENKIDTILRKYGWIAIVGSAWVPVVGDFIPIVAGTKKWDISKFAIALSIGKTTRALAITYFSSFLIGGIFRP